MVIQNFKSKDLSEVESNISGNVEKEESVQMIPIINRKSVLCTNLYKSAIQVFVFITFITNIIILLIVLHKNNTIKNLQTQLDLLQHDVNTLKYRFIDDNLLKEMAQFQLESYADEPEEDNLDEDFSDYNEMNRGKREVMAATLDGVPIITESYAEQKRRNKSSATSTNDQSTTATTTSERLRLYESLGKYTPVQQHEKQRTFHTGWTTRTSVRSTGTKSTMTPLITRTSRVMHTDKDKTKLFRKMIKKSLVKSSPNLQEHVESATVTERRPHRHSKTNNGRRSSLVEASDLFAAHFHGNTTHLVEGQHKGYRGNGHIAHATGRYVNWSPTSWIRTNTIQLNQGDVIVRESGLYFVYAQIYYVDEHDINGFEITHNNHVLAQCVTMTHSERRIDKRNTCWTGTLVALSDGDTISIRDIERNRYAYLTHGTSFFGLIKLADLNTNTHSTTRQPIK